MRISERRLPTALLAGALLAAGGCDRHDPAPPPADVAGATVIGCVLGGGAAQRCTVERVRAGAGVALVLRHPDGGFRRLLVSADGRGVSVADGAAPATMRRVGPREIEIAVDGDRYRLPAAP